MQRSRMARAAALTSLLITIALTGCSSSASFSGHPAWLTAQEPASARPAYFIDNEAPSPEAGYGWSDFTVRQTSTGAAVAQQAGRLSHRVTAVAAIGTGRAFILAEEAPNSCASQLYWFRLDEYGRAGRLSPVGAPLIGEVNSLAASADGRTIVYTVSGCARGDGGSLTMLDARTGRIRQWTSVDLTDNGSLGLASDLSLSANGRLLAFVGWSPRQHQASVRFLATGARPGQLARRSKVILRLPATTAGAEPRDGIAISPSGTAFYLCTVAVQPGQQVTSIAAYSGRSGRPAGAPLQFTARDPAAGHPLPGCSMAVSQGGGYALVPFTVSYPRPGSGQAALSVASVDLVTWSATAVLTFPVRQDAQIAGPQAADVRITW